MSQQLGLLGVNTKQERTSKSQNLGLASVSSRPLEELQEKFTLRVKLRYSFLGQVR